MKRRQKFRMLWTGMAFFILSAGLLIGGCETIMDWIVSRASESHIELAEIRQIGPEGVEIEFDLPQERRAWPFYVVKNEKDDYFEESIDVELFIENTGDEAFWLRRRELEGNERTRTRVAPGDRSLVYSGDLEILMSRLDIEDRRRYVDGRRERWAPLVSILHDAPPRGTKLRGRLILRAERNIKLKQPMKWYTYVPPDTL